MGSFLGNLDLARGPNEPKNYHLCLQMEEAQAEAQDDQDDLVEVENVPEVVPAIPSKAVGRGQDRRASGVRKIIYLKRRCIRCYFVNLIAALIQLLVHGFTLTNHFDILYRQQDLLWAISLFVLSTIMTILGSGIAIFAMTRQLRKLALFTGYLIMTLALGLNATAAAGEQIFEPDPHKTYGYQRDLIEDCQQYPDHTFSFILSPKSRRGEPIVQSSQHDHDAEEIEALAFPDDEITTTTEEIVTETFPCDEMLSNIRKFQTSYYCMAVLFLITLVTYVLSIIGLIQLYYLHRRRAQLSTISVALIEPYELVEPYIVERKNPSAASSVWKEDRRVRRQKILTMAKKRQEYLNWNKEFTFEIL